ncbi:MAG TPA: hypothetical protein VHJ20_22955 [Polyangia bacterium]|nr:hypothetical protein [Polyangia bacterium]
MVTSFVPLVFLFAQVDPSLAPPPPPPPAIQPSTAAAPGASLLNPAISLILDGTFGYYGKSRADFRALGLPLAGDDPAGPSPAMSATPNGREGFGVQEVELAASAAIDPYLEGAVFLTIPNLDGLEVEEAYLVTTALPANLQFKAGTFRSQLGRNNTQHLHLQNFTRRPLMTALLFGEDGLRGPGAQASVLLPLPWFATFFVEAFSIGAPDDPTIEPTFTSTFGGGARDTPRNLTYTAVLEQSWDLGDDTTAVLGLNFATGRAVDCAPPAATCDATTNGAPRSYLYGGDFYLKWKPANVAQSYASLQWTTEVFARTVADGGATAGAGYTEPVLQFARRWYVGGRFDVTGLPTGERDGVVTAGSLPRRYGYAASLTFAPSEFSRFRLYAQELAGPGVPSSTVGFLQAEMSMGAHGAHPF